MRTRQEQIEATLREIERLKEVIDDQNEVCWNCKKSVEDFAEKIKKKGYIIAEFDCNEYLKIDMDTFNELLKEYKE